MKNITIKSLRAKQKDVSKLAKDFFQKDNDGNKETKEEPYEPKRLKKIIRFVFSFFFVLTVGGFGGILIDRFAIPYFLVKYPSLKQYEFLEKVGESTTIIETVKEIKISEDRASVETIKKVLPSVVQVELFSKKNNKYLDVGNGTVITSDGLIIISRSGIGDAMNGESVFGGINKEVEQEYSNINSMLRVKLRSGEVYDARVVSEDTDSKFEIIKINEINLPVAAFGDSDKLELGEKLIFLGDTIAMDIVSGFLRNVDSISNDNSIKRIRVKIVNSLNDSFSGSPVVNIRGEIIGISQGGNLFVPINEVREFIDDVIKM